MASLCFLWLVLEKRNSRDISLCAGLRIPVKNGRPVRIARLASFYSLSAARTAYCFFTTMLFAVVFTVNPFVTLVNSPLSEPNVRAV